MTCLETVVRYHEATKHRFEGFARGPGRKDWDTHPDPFRRYDGAPLILLGIEEPGEEPGYDAVFSADSRIPPASLDSRSMSRLLYDSMSFSAWKSAGGVSWPLRINPSSGNLHPTECYLLCGAVSGLCTSPLVCHYAPKEHCLEVRAEIPCELWEKLTGILPGGTILIGLSSIHWRESWKYGERGYRYCQLDVGHALAAVALSAAALGWEARLLDEPGSDQIGQLLGVTGQSGAESEEPDCLLAMYPRGDTEDPLTLNLEAVPDFGLLHWQGIPNRLSPSHRELKRIDEVAEASRKPPLQQDYPPYSSPVPGISCHSFNGPFRRIIRQRRSAVAMDGVSSMPLDTFYALLERSISLPKTPPFSVFPCPSCVDLIFFVHRVDGLFPGLCLLLRNRRRLDEVRELLDVEFLWVRPESCPKGLDFYLLTSGDARNASMEISCAQDIASEGCFSLGMLAEFLCPLEKIGPWFYPRLFWECGMIGQVLYLEAEAAGLRGTGIGSFFDDPTHELFGLTSNLFQDLYHFTVGGPVEDSRIATMPTYPSEHHNNS